MKSTKSRKAVCKNERDYMKILVIPGCDDTNRGDQALIWESVRVAKDAGILGDYYMVSTDEASLQSKQEGIFSIPYILPHPSTHFKKLNDNRQYTLKLRILWGMRALGDLCVAAPLKNKYFRKILKLFLSSDRKKSLSIFEEAEVAIVKGGGFLHSKPGLSEAYKIYFFLYHIDLALAMGIPVLIMPNSFGKFESKITRKMIMRTLGKCSLVTSRENISRRILADECNVNSITTMDLGAYLQKDDMFDALTYLRSKKIPVGYKRCVVITVRPYRFPGKNNPDVLYKRYIESLISLMKWLNDNDYYVVLAEHVYSDNYHESDIKAIEDIKTILAEEKSITFGIIADHSLNCRQMKAIYSCFDYMVGTRFHSVIFALFSNVPSIAITYGGNKGVGIMKDLGIKEYSIAIDEISKDKLIETFKAMIKNRESYLDRFIENKQVVMKQREELIELIQQSIGKKSNEEFIINS